MSYFDNTTVCYPPNSTPATYNSYMCKSKGDYSCPDTERLLKTIDYDQIWRASHEKCTIHNKTHHISKLRSILSETISNITKDSQLLKGESVELTLEIELMKTENHTPTNSMVEVTIIQHNKKEHGVKKLTSTNPKQTVTTNSCTSESASQKRRNWFQRVISRQNDQNQNIINKNVTNNFRTHIDSCSGFNLDQKLIYNNNIKSTNKHPRSNFIKVLPEKIPIDADFKKGYRKVSPEKKTPNDPFKCQNPTVGKMDRKKKSVVKKISEIFLPTKKSHKNKAVNTALNALKNEVENIKLNSKKDIEGNKKTKKAPVHNLGKLVGNILDDMMDTSNNASNNEIKHTSQPIKYQHFFEPVVKRTELIQQKKRTELSKKSIVQSHSDTCCLNFKYNSSDLIIKTSNSTSDCRSHNHIKSCEKGDSTELTSTKKYKDKNQNHKKNQRKHAKGDATAQFDNKVTRKRLHKNSKTIGTKKSIIEWNGQRVEVNKEIKTKIEMLIVNELQNLALKEGMECDVIPLHSSEICNDQPVEKMSSFICELDISDKNVKKATKSKRKIKETKLVPNNQTDSGVFENNHNSSKLKQKHNVQTNKNLETNILQPIKTDTPIISVAENLEKSLSIGSGLTVNKQTTSDDIVPTMKKEYNDDVKITYVNMNIKSWSTESNTLQFKSPETSTPTGHTYKDDCSESQVFKFGEESYLYQKAISSGFIKKIGSNDSTWQNGWLETTNKINSEENWSKQLVTVNNTKSMLRFSSATSNEYQSSIEIELDIRDLELILQEAKQKQKADKVLVSAKCKRGNKKERNIKFTGKNSPSYTRQLLSNAAEKLEKYSRRKKKQ